MVLKIFSASGRLLAFLIFFIAVIIWFSKLSITNKIKQILPPATNTSTPFKVAQGGFFLYGKSNLLKKKTLITELNEHIEFNGSISYFSEKKDNDTTNLTTPKDKLLILSIEKSYKEQIELSTCKYSFKLLIQFQIRSNTLEFYAHKEKQSLVKK